MKCALLSVLDSSSVVPLAGTFWFGRSFVKRENRDWGGGGGRFRIDFPGVGIVTAEEDAGLGEWLARVVIGGD